MSNTPGAYIGPLENPFWVAGADRDEFGDVPPIPRVATDVTPELINRIIASLQPDVKVDEVNILDAHVFGLNPNVVSSANRMRMTVRYVSTGSAGGSLPRDLLLKVARNDVKIGPIYANETRLYTRILPDVTIEKPLCLGAVYDPDTQGYALILGNLVAAGARFPNVRDDVSEEHITALVDTLAKLHAAYWESPRFTTDLAWVENHVDSPLARFMTYVSSTGATQEAENEQFKRELIEDLGTTPEELIRGTQAVQAHQATLARTLCHGDAHIGNTYIHPDGRVGLCDWQLTSRGHCMHDINYMITTALSIDQRRAMERDLLTFYLERLRAYGVNAPPPFETIWTEYRRAVIWGFWVGWVSTPLSCYGWEVTVANHLRLAACIRDHDSLHLMRAVM
jgi:thiamine kinase-like enzyme